MNLPQRRPPDANDAARNPQLCARWRLSGAKQFVRPYRAPDQKDRSDGRGKDKCHKTGEPKVRAVDAAH
jgi:hypothetical protein